MESLLDVLEEAKSGLSPLNSRVVCALRHCETNELANAESE